MVMLHFLEPAYWVWIVLGNLNTCLSNAELHIWQEQTKGLYLILLNTFT
jgi:hypothetical protein